LRHDFTRPSAHPAALGVSLDYTDIMKNTINSMCLTAAAALILTVSARPTAATVSADAAERFTAFAADLSTTGNGRTARIDIAIDRWSTPEEREQLRTVLVEKGTDAVYTALQKMKPVGRIRVNDSLGWDLRYAREVKTGDGRRIVFATDRPISPAEATRRPRSIDYKFTIGELKLTGDKGQGTLSPAVKLRYDKDDQTLELENLASEPVRLMEVRETK
jgi:hypothetical protein